MKEEYQINKEVLDKLYYLEHQSNLCWSENGELGQQQSGYANYPCFLCLRDSRDKAQHWLRKDWPVRENMALGVDLISSMLPPYYHHSM